VPNLTDRQNHRRGGLRSALWTKAATKAKVAVLLKATSKVEPRVPAGDKDSKDSISNTTTEHSTIHWSSEEVPLSAAGIQHVDTGTDADDSNTKTKSVPVVPEQSPYGYYYACPTTSTAPAKETLRAREQGRLVLGRPGSPIKRKTGHV
jgi:hypothetical protein